MSHLSQIKVEVKDLVCLGKAANELGGKLNRNETTFKYYGSNVTPCDHNISFMGCDYHVGVVKDQEVKGQAYKLLFDAYSYGGLGTKIGTNGGKLVQKYTEQVTRKAAMLKNYSVREQKDIVDGPRIKTRIEIFIP